MPILYFKDWQPTAAAQPLRDPFARTDRIILTALPSQCHPWPYA